MKDQILSFRFCNVAALETSASTSLFGFEIFRNMKISLYMHLLRLYIYDIYKSSVKMMEIFACFFLIFIRLVEHQLMLFDLQSP